MKKTASSLSIWLLFVLGFMVQMDHLMMVPLSSDIAKAIDMPLTESGLLVSIYPIAAAISAFFLAPFSDRFGRKRMLLFLGTGFALSCLGCAMASNLEQMYLFRILSGVFGGLVLPNALAFAGDEFDDNAKVRAISTLTLAFPVASVMGVPIGAWLGDLYSWRLPFYALAALSLLCVAGLTSMQVSSGTKEHSIGRQYIQLLALWRNRRIQVVFAIQFFMLIGLFGFVPNLSVFLVSNFDMSTTAIGLCYMQGGVGAILGNVLARQLMQREFGVSLITAGSIIMALSLLGVTLEVFSAPFIGLSFAITMFGGSMRFPALQMILTDLVSTDLRGRLLAMSMIVSNLTMGLGGVWSLPLLEFEGERLVGMELIGLITFVSLCFVPPLVMVLQRIHK